MIPINRPDITPELLDYYFELKYSNYSKGSKINKLEESFASIIGSGYYALFTGSAKMSFYLLLKALQLKGNIITSPLTCFAALSPIVAAGLKPKFVDINPSTFLIDDHKVEEMIDRDTCAILSISMGGVSPSMEKLVSISKKYSLPLIEDCAQSLGSKYNEKLLGGFGDYSFYSFTKHLSLVGGGMLLSKNKDVIERARKMQDKLESTPESLLDYRFKRDIIELNLGKTLVDEYYKVFFLNKIQEYKETNPNDIFESKSVACKPNDFQAGVLLKQLERLNDIVKKRRNYREMLMDELKEYPDVHFQYDNGESSFSKLYITTPFDNKELIKELNKEDIDAKQLTKSHGIYLQQRIDETKFYYDESIQNCQEYFKIHNAIIELPLSSKMTKDEIQNISKALKKYFNENSKT